MITVSAEQLNAYMVMFFFPFVRIMAWMATDPLLGNRSAPLPARVSLALLLALTIAPLLPAVPQVPLVSGEGILILVQQIVIGVCIGFTLRIVFAAVEMAGQFMGLQMGLSFATLFDPVNGAQTPVLSQFLVLTTALILFALNGHHLIIQALVSSFEIVPISADPIASKGLFALVQWGGSIFSIGLQIALPVTATVLAANLAIGMMTRAAPQLNIFAIGFPLTLAAGFSILYLGMSYLPPLVERFWAAALQALDAMLRGFAP